MSCKLNNLSKLTSGRAVIDVSDYNIIERMFSTLPPPTVARPEEGSLEYRAQPSLKWANFDWISIRPQPAADGVEEVAKSDFIALLNSQPGELLFQGITTWVHVIVCWLRVDTWHGLDTLGSAATAQTITGSLILIVAPHYSDCLLSQLSHTKAAFMPWIDFQLYMLYYFANRQH